MRLEVVPSARTITSSIPHAAVVSVSRGRGSSAATKVRRKKSRYVASSPGLRNAGGATGGLASRHASRVARSRDTTLVYAPRSKAGALAGLCFFLPRSTTSVSIASPRLDIARSASPRHVRDSNRSSAYRRHPSTHLLPTRVAIARVSIRTGHLSRVHRVARRVVAAVEVPCAPSAEGGQSKIPVVATSHSLWDSERLSSVSSARGGRCGWCSARWAPSVRPRPWSRGPRWGTARCSARPRRRARAVPPSAVSHQPRRPHRNHPSCVKRRDARRTTDWPSPSTKRSSGTSS